MEYMTHTDDKGYNEWINEWKMRIFFLNDISQNYNMNYLSVFSLQHGTTKASEFFNLQEFYTKYIYPELERKNGKGSVFHSLLQIS